MQRSARSRLRTNSSLDKRARNGAPLSIAFGMDADRHWLALHVSKCCAGNLPILGGNGRSNGAEWQEEALAALRQTEQADVGFVEFAQWIAHEQLDLCRVRARERNLPIGLYLDIAVGVRSDGFDAWSDQDAILSGTAVGAPPDVLNTAGQNWGLTGFNPVGLEDRQFRPFRRMLQASMRYAGAIRLDHVLGLKRLYLIPHGLRPSEGAYIRFPFEALLGVAALSSVRHKCIVIGEDLGTVPENFRETLADWGIWTCQVMLFERQADGAFCAPEHYRENALVTFGTHDVPTFAGWRDQRDLAVRQALGIDPGESSEQRRGAFDALRQVLRQHGIEADDFAAVARFLADTPSRLLVISLEDLLGLRIRSICRARPMNIRTGNGACRLVWRISGTSTRSRVSPTP